MILSLLFDIIIVVKENYQFIMIISLISIISIIFTGLIVLFVISMVFAAAFGFSAETITGLGCIISSKSLLSPSSSSSSPLSSSSLSPSSLLLTIKKTQTKIGRLQRHRIDLENSRRRRATRAKERGRGYKKNSSNNIKQNLEHKKSLLNNVKNNKSIKCYKMGQPTVVKTYDFHTPTDKNIFTTKEVKINNTSDNSSYLNLASSLSFGYCSGSSKFEENILYRMRKSWIRKKNIFCQSSLQIRKPLHSNAKRQVGNTPRNNNNNKRKIKSKNIRIQVLQQFLFGQQRQKNYTVSNRQYKQSTLNFVRSIKKKSYDSYDNRERLGTADITINS